MEAETGSRGQSWDLFLAYDRADAEAARELVSLLAGLRVFFDQESLEEGEDWGLETPAAQERSACTVILLSSRTRYRTYLRDEIDRAIHLARPPARRHRLVPVFLDGIPADRLSIPYGLGQFQALDALQLGGLSGVAARLRRLLGPALHARDGEPPPERTSGPYPTFGDFVGRRQEIAAFEKALLSPGPPRALVILGEGGIGKTWLLKGFTAVLPELVKPLWLVHEDAPRFSSPFDICEALLSFLPGCGDLQPRLSRLRGLRARLNEALRYDVQSSPGERAGASTEGFEREQGSLLSEVSARIRALSVPASPAVLVLDNLEAVDDRSFLPSFNTFVERLGLSNVLIVLAGRRLPEGLELPLEILPVDELASSEADELLRRRGARDHSRLRTDRRLREVVIACLGGHPMFLEIAADSVKKDRSISAEEFLRQSLSFTRHDLVSRFLIPRYLSRLMQQTAPGPESSAEQEKARLRQLAILAIPRWLDQGLAEHLGGGDLFRALQENSAWILDGHLDDLRVFRFQDRVADLLRAVLEVDDPEAVLMVHRAVADWALQAIERSGVRRPLVFLHQYHLFHVDPEAARLFFERVYKPASDDNNIELCRLLLENLAGIHFPLSRTLVWIKLREGDYHRIQRDFESADQIYSQALHLMDEHGDDDALTRCSLLVNLGIVCVSRDDSATLKRGLKVLRQADEIARAARLTWHRALIWNDLGIGLHGLAARNSRASRVQALRLEAVEAHCRSRGICRRQLRRIQMRIAELPPEAAVARAELGFMERRYLLTHAKTMHNLGRVKIGLGATNSAVRSLSIALKGYQRAGNSFGVAEVVHMLSTLKPQWVGDYEKLHRASANVYRSLGDSAKEAIHLFETALLALNNNRLEEWAVLTAHAFALTLRNAVDFELHQQLVRSALQKLAGRAPQSPAETSAIVHALRSRLYEEEVLPALARLEALLVITEETFAASAESDSADDLWSRIFDQFAPSPPEGSGG